MSRCAECGTRSTKRSYHRVQRLAGGSYRATARIIWTTVCDQCVRDAVIYRDRIRAEHRNPGSHWGKTRMFLGSLALIYERKLT